MKLHSTLCFWPSHKSHYQAHLLFLISKLKPGTSPAQLDPGTISSFHQARSQGGPAAKAQRAPPGGALPVTPYLPVSLPVVPTVSETVTQRYYGKKFSCTAETTSSAIRYRTVDVGFDKHVSNHYVNKSYLLFCT